MITRPYKLAFFRYVNEYLSEEDFAKMLKYCYIETEYVSDNVNISKSDLLKYFIKARKYIMSEKELEKYNALPEQVEIFRGVGDSKYIKCFSWTLEQEKATWFANRFNSKTPHVYRCLINKKDILAYISDKEEDEVIVNVKKLTNYNISEII